MLPVHLGLLWGWSRSVFYYVYSPVICLIRGLLCVLVPTISGCQAYSCPIPELLDRSDECQYWLGSACGPTRERSHSSCTQILVVREPNVVCVVCDRCALQPLMPNLVTGGFECEMHWPCSWGWVLWQHVGSIPLASPVAPFGALGWVCWLWSALGDVRFLLHPRSLFCSLHLLRNMSIISCGCWWYLHSFSLAILKFSGGSNWSRKCWKTLATSFLSASVSAQLLNLRSPSVPVDNRRVAPAVLFLHSLSGNTVPALVWIVWSPLPGYCFPNWT